MAEGGHTAVTYLFQDQMLRVRSSDAQKLRCLALDARMSKRWLYAPASVNDMAGARCVGGLGGVIMKNDDDFELCPKRDERHYDQQCKC